MAKARVGNGGKRKYSSLLAPPRLAWFLDAEHNGYNIKLEVGEALLAVNYSIDSAHVSLKRQGEWAGTGTADRAGQAGDHSFGSEYE